MFWFSHIPSSLRSLYSHSVPSRLLRTALCSISRLGLAWLGLVQLNVLIRAKSDSSFHQSQRHCETLVHALVSNLGSARLICMRQVQSKFGLNNTNLYETSVVQIQSQQDEFVWAKCSSDSVSVRDLWMPRWVPVPSQQDKRRIQADSTNKAVNQCSKDAPQTQQQRPESPNLSPVSYTHLTLPTMAVV